MNQAELEATLTTAEAVLARTVINAVDVGAGWVATAATLDKVRGCCRELRSALYQLRCSESADDLDIARKCCREIRSVLLELNRSASIPFRCLDPSCSLLATPRRTCWCNSLEDTLSGPLRLEAASGRADSLPPPLPEHIVRPTDIGYRAQAPVAADTRVWPRLLRQGSELLALILAYLNLYFIDVELDILRMPSMFVAALP